jgi:hypothetical protein
MSRSNVGKGATISYSQLRQAWMYFAGIFFSPDQDQDRREISN